MMMESLMEKDSSIIKSARTVIEINGIEKHFIDKKGQMVEVIRDITLDIKEKEFMSIIGPSGCGKSTMFNIIAGLLEPSRGGIKVNGRSVTGSDGQVGYMMQRDMLLPWRTVLDNVVIGLEIKNVPKNESHEKAMHYLKRYGLDGFAHAYPHTLSGGMKQRVALIRTLVLDPDIIFLDEPFSALDYQTKLVLQEEIINILREFGKTVVLITHDIGEAITMSDRIAVLSSRPTYVKKVYDVGLISELGSAMKVRSDQRYTDYFGQIWSDLDLQIGGIE